MRVTFTCRECGGETQARDAWAEWDEAGQQFVLRASFDRNECRGCRAEERPPAPSGPPSTHH